MQIDKSISTSEHFGNLKFSVRNNYISYFLEHGLASSEDEIWTNPELVSLIHWHWHGEGRTGCIFALLSARRAEEKGWLSYVFSESASDLHQPEKIMEMNEKIESCINDPKCEILSLLFSKVETNQDLLSIIDFLLKSDRIFLYEEKNFDDNTCLSLRMPIEPKSIVAWLMAFGPFSYFPQTRQSPITEIAIRVKPKPKVQFHRLSKDSDAAHLADLPLDYSEDIIERIWQNTYNRTRKILGEEPNDFSAARTTFTLPSKIWITKA